MGFSARFRSAAKHLRDAAVIALSDDTGDGGEKWDNSEPQSMPDLFAGAYPDQETAEPNFGEYPVRKGAGEQFAVSAPELQQAIGSIGWRRIGGLIQSDPNYNWHPYSARGLVNAHGWLTKMLYTDPVVKSGDRALRSVLQQATLEFDAAGGATDATDLEKQVADFFGHSLDSMKGGQSGLLEYASNFPSYGHCAAETVLEYRDTQWGNLLCLRELAPRLPWSVSHWIFHEEGPLAGQPAAMAQASNLGYPGLTGGRAIDMDRLCLWSLDYDTAGPEGIPLLRTVFFSWRAKRKVQEADAHIFTRWGKGVPIAEQLVDADITRGPNQAVTARVVEILRNYVTRASGFLVSPYGWKVSTLFPAHTAPDPAARVQMYDQQILVVYFALYLLHGTGTSGTLTATGEHITAFRNAIEHYAKHIGEVLASPNGRPGTGILPRLARANFAIPPNFRWPSVRVTGIKHRDVAAIIQAVGFLLQSGGLQYSEALAKYLADMIGAPRDIAVIGAA